MTKFAKLPTRDEIRPPKRAMLTAEEAAACRKALGVRLPQDDDEAKS